MYVLYIIQNTLSAIQNLLDLIFYVIPNAITIPHGFIHR